MTAEINQVDSLSVELESRLKKTSALFGCILILGSLINLIGWASGIDWMQPPYVGTVSMKISAAICFLLSGLALICRQLNKRWRWLTTICTVLLAGLVVLILLAFFQGIHWLPASGGNLSVLLISPAPTIIFGFATLGLFLAPRGKQDWPSIVVLTTGSLGFFTRVFGIRVFHENYGFGYFPEAGVDTYLSFLACAFLATLGFGILVSNPRSSLFGLLCSTTRGGYITRRILPLAIALPLFWAAITTAGEFAHWYNQPVRWTLFVNGTILSFCLLTCQIAKRLDEIDRSRIILAEKRADIVYSLAHDLKVPIIGATQSLDLLLKEALGQLQAQQKSLLSVLRDSMNDQLWMIENLVYEYQTEQGKEAINPHACFVDKLLDDCLEKIMPAMQAKNLKVYVNHENPDACLSADSVAMRRVINNLLHNALKHSPRNGHIEIKSSADDVTYTFSIWNSGPVISDAQKSHLFERFWQSEEGHNRHIGNGLGLYICRQIIEAHRGRITCLSELGQGTSFAVALPLDRSDLEAGE